MRIETRRIQIEINLYGIQLFIQVVERLHKNSQISLMIICKRIEKILNKVTTDFYRKGFYILMLELNIVGYAPARSQAGTGIVYDRVQTRTSNG